MTGVPHVHRTFVRGCFRCDLSREEAMDALEVERDEYKARIRVLEARIEELEDQLEQLWGRPERCRSSFTDRSDEHRLYECIEVAGHAGEHRAGHGARWTGP